MSTPKDDLRIAIFSISLEEREYLRNCINGIAATVLAFEKETIVFDNYKAFVPKIVIARTDSLTIVWRFLFAMYALESDAALLIASDQIKREHIDLSGLSIEIRCIPATSNRALLNETIQQLIHAWQPQKAIPYKTLLVGESLPIKQIRSSLPVLSEFPEPVLISGEGGTGKELLARLIVSHRPCTFIKINCSDLKPEMIARLRMPNNYYFMEHHPPGASPLPVLDHYPLVILLDRVEKLHPLVQSEVLLFMEGAGHPYRNEADSGENFQIKFIVTTEADLESLIKQDRFRKDLYYRLNAFPIHMPALRHRPIDIPLLIDYFMLEACARAGNSFFLPEESICENLSYHEWPGNLDELKSLIYRLVVTRDESLIIKRYNIARKQRRTTTNPWQLVTRGDIFPDAIEIRKSLSQLDKSSLKGICNTYIARTEKKIMQKVLESTNWNRKKAAALLNISYKSMLNKMKEYEIN